MKTRIWLLSVLLILFHKPANAGVASAMKAGDLMDECRYVEADLKKLSSTELSSVTACMSYISGVVDGYAVGVVTSSRERTMMCDVPEEVTLKQMALIVLHFGKENPSELHLPASIITLKALNKSFPCKGASQ
jgi:Rap1a immunity proteins